MQPSIFTIHVITSERALTTVNLLDVREEFQRTAISKRDVDDTVAGEGGYRVDDGGFLSTSRCAGRDEDAGKLAYQRTFPPQVISTIPESLSEM
jgi:hypothetical protein